MPDLTGRDWAGIGLAGAGGLLPLAFGSSSDNTKGPLDALTKNAQSMTDLAKTLNMQGMDLFGPASDYLKKLLSGNRQDILQATAPERARVIDQYATAKKALATFTPRGGGQAAAAADLQAKEASDLSQIGAQARSGAVGTALTTGTQLTGQGISASGAAANDYAAILSDIERQNEQKAQGLGGLGQALGTIAGFLFL